MYPFGRLIPFSRRIAATVTITAVTSQEYGSSQLSNVDNRRRTTSGTPLGGGGSDSGPVGRTVMSVSAAAVVTPRS
jgi:hypothetical protein